MALLLELLHLMVAMDYFPGDQQSGIHYQEIKQMEGPSTRVVLGNNQLVRSSQRKDPLCDQVRQVMENTALE
jgi:hypothetical protein